MNKKYFSPCTEILLVSQESCVLAGSGNIKGPDKGDDLDNESRSANLTNKIDPSFRVKDVD